MSGALERSSEDGAPTGSPEPLAAPPVPRAVIALWAMAMLGLVVLKVSPLTFVDPDLWHQMSLARELWATGQVPRVDVFAYTPTLRPLVHHEWGAGVIALAVASAGGPALFLLLKYLLVAGVLALSVRAARQRGADAATLLACALPAILAAHYGFTTIRAQLWTLLALAFLMNVLAEDEAGKRRWMLPWLVVHVLWVNVHAGFVVGLGFLGLWAVERALRREPFLHLAAVVAVAVALTLVNPWGLDYLTYLARGLLHERANITEWAPLWVDLRLRWADLATWTAMLALASYAVFARGPRECRGIPIVAVSFVFALLHQRHITILAVTWLALVTPWLAQTPLAEQLRQLVTRRARLFIVLGALGFVVWSSAGMLSSPWALKVPADLDARHRGWPTYPVGAADYLSEARFRGNVMTPFVEGAYMMWRLHPQGGLVSHDGRFEAAYVDAVSADHTTFYSAAPGWEAVLGRYPTDVVLVPRHFAVLRPLQSLPGWSVVYGDDLYVLVARGELELPFVDRRGMVFRGSFP